MPAKNTPKGKRRMHRRTLMGAGLATLPLAAATLPQAALGQSPAPAEWPTRPIRTIVPFPPGGPADITARLYAPVLSALLKQTVLVENRAGGSGVVGTDYALKSPADGYTLATINGGSLVITPHVLANMPFRVPEDVTPLSVVMQVPEALVAHPGLGVKTLPELLDLAKRRPGTLNIGTAGASGISHLAALLFRMQTGASVEVVTYRGAAPAVTDLVGGQIQLLFADLPVLMPHIAGGTMTPIALAARQRSPDLPALPTTGEFGFPKLLAENWYCTVGPAGLPPAVAETLSRALKAASETPAVKDALAAQGAQAAWMSMADFARFIVAESALWRDVVVSSGVKFE
jgi:tripartite-type tricarboxylate transporter receptor subunit TctC